MDQWTLTWNYYAKITAAIVCLHYVHSERVLCVCVHVLCVCACVVCVAKVSECYEISLALRSAWRFTNRFRE